VRKITEDLLDLAIANGVDFFTEISFEVDACIQMPRFVTLAVFSVGTDKTALDRPEAFPVRTFKEREKFWLGARFCLDRQKSENIRQENESDQTVFFSERGRISIIPEKQERRPCFFQRILPFFFRYTGPYFAVVPAHALQTTWTEGHVLCLPFSAPFLYFL
jgi:hypothetical protein